MRRVKEQEEHYHHLEPAVTSFEHQYVVVPLWKPAYDSLFAEIL